jgi:PKD repeat protein
MKKSKHYALLILSACMLFFGCEKDPTASFSVSATLVETNQVVAFNNSSVDADHYEWYFGDGTMSTDVNPTHSYSQAGYYIVTLIAYSKSGRKMDDAYRVFLEVVNPTQLTITVLVK